MIKTVMVTSLSFVHRMLYKALEEKVEKKKWNDKEIEKLYNIWVRVIDETFNKKGHFHDERLHEIHNMIADITCVMLDHDRVHSRLVFERVLGEWFKCSKMAQKSI